MPVDEFETVTPETQVMLEIRAEREIVTVAELYSRLKPDIEPKNQGDWESLLWSFDAEMVG